MPDLVGPANNVEGDLDVDGALSQADDPVIDSGESVRVVVYDDTTTPSTAGVPSGTLFVAYDADG